MSQTKLYSILEVRLTVVPCNCRSWILNIILGVVQYEALIDLPEDFYSTQSRRKKQNIDTSREKIDQLISQVFYFNTYSSFNMLHYVHRLMNTSRELIWQKLLPYFLWRSWTQKTLSEDNLQKIYSIKLTSLNNCNLF